MLGAKDKKELEEELRKTVCEEREAARPLSRRRNHGHFGGRQKVPLGVQGGETCGWEEGEPWKG